MAPKNSPLNYTSIDLEIEAIRRFRSLVPFLPTECRVFRSLEGSSTVLCLDFADCPQELSVNVDEFALLLALSSHYLGLANSLLFKIGNQIVVRMTMAEII